MLLNFSENFYGLILLMKSESQTKEEKYCFLLFLLFEKQECFFTYQFIPYTLRIFLWIWNFQKCLNYRNHRFRRNLWLENSPRGQTFSINPEGRRGKWGVDMIRKFKSSNCTWNSSGGLPKAAHRSCCIVCSRSPVWPRQSLRAWPQWLSLWSCSRRVPQSLHHNGRKRPAPSKVTHSYPRSQLA